MEIRRASVFSEDRKHRYQLLREWSADPLVMCIGLNPSTANEDTDDPTITYLTKVLTLQGFGGFVMTNLYALVSSKPEVLFAGHDSIGDNDKWLILTAREVKTIICCWGDFKFIDYRVKKVLEIIPKNIPIKCFGRNKNGTPSHPMAFQRRGIKPENINLIDFNHPQLLKP